MRNTWDYEKSTFITAWSEELWNYSIPSLFYPLTEKERDDFFELIFLEEIQEEKQQQLAYFEEKISPAFQTFPDGVFLRNDRRSPKDSEGFFGREIQPAYSPKQALSFCLWSERTWLDFKIAKENHHQPVLIARKWVPMSPEREFRCFVKDGVLFAITQYEYRNQFEWIHHRKDSIPERILGFFETIKKWLPHSTVVFDVYIGDDNITLIETNPYGLSDPCLYKSYENLESILKESTKKISFLYQTHN